MRTDILLSTSQPAITVPNGIQTYERLNKDSARDSHGVTVIAVCLVPFDRIHDARSYAPGLRDGSEFLVVPVRYSPDYSDSLRNLLTARLAQLTPTEADNRGLTGLPYDERLVRRLVVTSDQALGQVVTAASSAGIGRLLLEPLPGGDPATCVQHAGQVADRVNRIRQPTPSER